MTDLAYTAAPTALPTTRVSVSRKVLRDPVAAGALLIFGIIVAVVLAAPLLTSWDPTRADLSAVLAPPGGGHLLGADSAGRDIFARLLYGGRTSLLGAVIALLTALAIGIPTGLIAGYYGRAFESVTNWIANLLMALPGLIVLLAVISVAGPRMPLVMTVFGILLAPGVYRLTRASVIAVRKELYVDAARVSGLSDTRIIGRHMLGVVRPPLVIQASIMAGIAIVLQAGLEFLGVGDASSPSWGQLLNEAFQNIYVAPLMLLWPGLAIGLTVGALALFGAAMRDIVQGTQHTHHRGGAVGGEVVPEPTVPVSFAQGDGSLLTVRGLRVGYPLPDGGTTVVVNGVDLSVTTGEVLGLVGESGSGKSQTAFSILGLLPPGGRVIGGTISFCGEPIHANAKAQAALRGDSIGYIPQEPMSNLDPSFTLGYQLTQPLRQHLKLSKAEAKHRALDLLDRVGIPDPERTFAAYPHEVSGGMAQRVLIAGAVSCDPQLLIADEPTTALDVTVQADVLDLLRSLQAERQMGLVLVTHNFGVVADLCDTVAVMQNGTIVEYGDVDTIFADPRHDYTRMLLDSTLENTAARPILGSEARS